MRRRGHGERRVIVGQRRGIVPAPAVQLGPVDPRGDVGWIDRERGVEVLAGADQGAVAQPQPAAVEPGANVGGIARDRRREIGDGAHAVAERRPRPGASVQVVGQRFPVRQGDVEVRERARHVPGPQPQQSPVPVSLRRTGVDRQRRVVVGRGRDEIATRDMNAAAIQQGERRSRPRRQRGVEVGQGAVQVAPREAEDPAVHECHVVRGRPGERRREIGQGPTPVSGGHPERPPIDQGPDERHALGQRHGVGPDAGGEVRRRSPRERARLDGGAQQGCLPLGGLPAQ